MTAKGTEFRKVGPIALIALAASASLAEAQYIGAGSTAPGDYLRGVGVAAWGMGEFNRNTAIGYSITVDANIRGDTYIQQVLRADRDNYAKLVRQRMAKEQAGYNAIVERIRDHPERLDVFRGSALNAIFDQLNDPGIQEASLRTAPVAIPREMIRRIPFKLDQKGLIFSLQRLTARGKGKWPPAFQQDPYASALKEYERAIDEAMDQMIDGKITNPTIDRYKAAVTDLTNRLEREYAEAGIPTTDTRYREAKTRLREMEKATELMKTHKSQSIMAAMDRYQGKNVNDLRKFMLEHNLRFADANPESEDERTLYVDLYAALDEVRKIVAPPGAQNR